MAENTNSSSSSRESDARAIIRSHRDMVRGLELKPKRAMEGGCGVIGIVGSDPLAGRLIIRSCEQMQNRGNGKGGGVAAVGLFPDFKEQYALHLAYLDETIVKAVEDEFVRPVFDIAHEEQLPTIDDHRAVGLEILPPTVKRYFVRVKKKVLDEFMKETGIEDRQAAEDDCVYQNSFRLNLKYYADTPKPSAFVLSHGHNLMILKAVGYAEQIARYYRLEEQKANVWIGHQRYPTRGRVWHPGGAHPFAGLHEALVHNGDFANYHASSEYLRQQGRVPLFVTDTEVSVLMFDLYSRVLNYPLEYVIEALAPTPEGDFERLTKRRQRIYRAIQAAHIHGSPDGPWFFIVARANPKTGEPQLIGITDVSMLRPQVFALQCGETHVGAIASEKQAIDAFFEELSDEDPRVSPVADRYWNARGGSCTDGGAFSFTVKTGEDGGFLDVRDKFGKAIEVTRKRAKADSKNSATVLQHAWKKDESAINTDPDHPSRLSDRFIPPFFKDRGKAVRDLAAKLVSGDRETISTAVRDLAGADLKNWDNALEILTFLRDRRWNTGERRRSMVLADLDRNIAQLLDDIPLMEQKPGFKAIRLDYEHAWNETLPTAEDKNCSLVLDARGFPPEGNHSVARRIVEAYRKDGYRHFIVYRTQGDRFLGVGLGPDSADVRIDVYGSSGDYLGSGMDGAKIYVHGDAQDQVGQILKAGRIVVFGSVGQTFLYGAKGGEAFIMGNAAGRPLINAVGDIRAIINGTCLDYCAESFMAGNEVGGGFVVINGLDFDERGEVIGMEAKYPGNNLFSLASGGACYLNDPYNTIHPSQLNGATFIRFKQEDWNVIRPYLRLNEELFGISIRHDLLMVDGVLKWSKEVFRKVVTIMGKADHHLDFSSLTT